MPVNCLLSKGVKWSWFKVKVKAESLFRLLVYLICCSCFTQRVFIVSVQWPWTNYLGTCLRLGSWRKIFVLQIVFSLPWSSLACTLQKEPIWSTDMQDLDESIFKGLRLTSYQEKKPRPNHTLVLSFNKYMLIECYWSMTLNKGQGLVHVPR